METKTPRNPNKKKLFTCERDNANLLTIRKEQSEKMFFKNAVQQVTKVDKCVRQSYNN